MPCRCFACLFYASHSLFRTQLNCPDDCRKLGLLWRHCTKRERSIYLRDGGVDVGPVSTRAWLLVSLRVTTSGTVSVALLVRDSTCFTLRGTRVSASTPSLTLVCGEGVVGGGGGTVRPWRAVRLCGGVSWGGGEEGARTLEGSAWMWLVSLCLLTWNPA